MKFLKTLLLVFFFGLWISGYSQSDGQKSEDRIILNRQLPVLDTSKTISNKTIAKKGTPIPYQVVQFRDSIPISELVQGNPDESRKGAMEATLPVVVLPSPNNASLVRMISENVDLYTGKLTLNVPIYTAKSNTIEIPISIQCDANAHRVNDIGSWIGLGNHLNAGGSITRVMKNLPDEFSENFSGARNISTQFNFPGVGYLSLKSAQYGSIRLERFGSPAPPLVPYSINEMKDIINKGNWGTKNNQPEIGYDLQPDEFYFNFGKYSGKFSFDQDGNIIFSTEANLKITPTISGGKITAFSVLTDDGYTYDFGNYSLNAVEESRLSTQSKTILFSYPWNGCFATNQPFETPNIFGSTTNPRLGTKNIYDGYAWVMSYLQPITICAGPQNCTYEPGNLMDFFQAANQYYAEFPAYPSSWYLTKITSPTNDFVSCNYIDNGTINYLSDRSFTSSGPVPASRYFTGIPQNYCHILDYPNLFTSFAPVKQNTPAPGFSHYSSFGDYTISANSIELKSKRLNSIILNDGSEIKFIATTNRTDFPGDKRLDKIEIKKDGVVYKEFLFDYDLVQSTEGYEALVFSFRRPVYSIFPGGQFCCLYYVNDSRTETGAYLNSSVLNRMYLTSIIEKGKNQEALPPFIFDYYNKLDLSFRTSINQDPYGYTKGPAIQPPVLEKLKAGVIKSIKYPTGGTKEFTFEISGNTVAWNGLRILQIKELESVSSNPIIKNYSYGIFYATDQAVNYYKLPDVVLPFGNPAEIYAVAEKAFGSNGRVNPEMLTKGAVGGYSYAEIRQPGNGSYRIEFSTSQNNPDIVSPTMLVTSLVNGGVSINLSNFGYSYPFTQATTNDWKRGLPLAEYYKAENGNTLKSTIYEYDLTSNAEGIGSSTGIQVSKYKIDFGTWNWMLYGKYAHYPRWQILKKKFDRTYDQNGLTYGEVITEYLNYKFPFSNREYMYPVTIRTSRLSKGEAIVERIRYPFEYSGVDEFSQGIENLKTKNVLNVPVERTTTINIPEFSNNIFVTGGVLNKYHTDKPLIKEVFKLKSNGMYGTFTPSGTSGGAFYYDINYKSEAQFPVYDATGHIQQQNKTNDISESYKWSYNNMYPVAKVANAANHEIDHTSFEPGDTYFSANSFNFSTSAVTGNYVRRLIQFDNLDFGNIAANKEYKLTFWQYGTFPGLLRVIGTNTTTLGTTQLLKSINSWNLIEVTIPAISSNSRVRFINNTDPSNNCLIDELRLHPSTAQMTTYTFDPLVGMTSETDINNKTTYYEYDGLNRLSVVKNDTKHIVKTNCYNYAGFPIPCAVNPVASCSAVINSVTQTASKQVSVDYTVSAGTTSCRIEVWDLNDLVIAWQNSPSCNSPATLNVPATGFYKVKVIAYSPYCSGGSVSSSFVIIKVKY